jgi:hypothetical protein
MRGADAIGRGFAGKSPRSDPYLCMSVLLPEVLPRPDTVPVYTQYLLNYRTWYSMLAVFGREAIMVAVSLTTILF